MTLIWLGIMNLFIGLLTIALSIPLVKGDVAKNNAYGVRIPTAMESDENWYQINRYGGRCLIGWSIPLIVVGIGLIVANFMLDTPPKGIVMISVFALSPLLLVGAYIQTDSWAGKHFGPPKG